MGFLTRVIISFVTIVVTLVVTWWCPAFAAVLLATWWLFEIEQLQAIAAPTAQTVSPSLNFGAFSGEGGTLLLTCIVWTVVTTATFLIISLMADPGGIGRLAKKIMRMILHWSADIKFLFRRGFSYLIGDFAVASMLLVMVIAELRERSELDFQALQVKAEAGIRYVRAHQWAIMFGGLQRRVRLREIRGEGLGASLGRKLWVL